MALDRPAYEKKTGEGNFWRYMLQQFFSMFLAGMFFSFVQGGARAVQPLMLDPGDPVLYGLAMAAAFLIGTLPFILINGGFIFVEVMIMGWIVGLLFEFFWDDVHSKADVFYKALHPWTILFGGILGLGLGFFVGYLFVWAIFGDTVWAFVITAPGPWPGFLAAFNVQAFAFEAIAGFMITLPIFYLYLKDKAQWVPVVGALMTGATALFGFNVSGGAFTLWSWVFANTVSCFTAVGCFPGDTGTWWWSYIFGMWAGATVAAIVAYLLHLMSDEYGSFFGVLVSHSVPVFKEGKSKAPRSKKQRKNAAAADTANGVAEGLFGEKQP